MTQFNIQGQYLKDMSIEHPNSPRIFLDQNLAKLKQNIGVNCNVNVMKINDSIFEITLESTVKSMLDNTDKSLENKTDKDLYAFIIEVKYSAIVSINGNLSDQELEEIFFVEVPLVLFPYIREKVSYGSLSCGFPSVMLSHIDFKQRYLEQKDSIKSQTKNKQENVQENNSI